VYVYKWNETQQQWDDASSGLPVPASDFYFISRLADMDMDGWLDLVFCSYNTATMQIWKGNGTSWSLMQSHYLPAMGSVSDIAIDDVDHNGFPDILLWARFQVTIFTSINKLKLFREASVAANLSITATYPRHFECFENNTVRFLHWISAVPSNHASGVMLELSTTGTGGPWTVIAASAPNNGTYQWTTPASVNSSNCFIRFTVTDSITGNTVSTMNADPFGIGTCDFPTAVKYTMPQNTLTLSPNPFSTTATVYSAMTNCSLKIMDLTGQIVLSIPQVNSFPFTLQRGALSSGIYFLEIQSADRTIERMKLVAE
jgi:hypothetical protein